jgi:recombination protein RecR
MSKALFSLPPAIRKLAAELARMPSIGEKSALRLAYNLIMRGDDLALTLAEALVQAKQLTKLCRRCFALTQEELCPICADPMRDRKTLCVVEKPVDITAIEQGSGFRGVYHVLHGLWSPLRGMSPEKTKIPELLTRVRSGEVQEIILATSTTVEGDATALYIAREFNGSSITMTRLAQGLPKGGELEYADQLTLQHAFSGRRSL